MQRGLVQRRQDQRLGFAAVSRLVAVFAAEVSHRLRLHEVSHRADPAKPRLHAQVQLLPLHHPGKRHPAAHAGKRCRGNARRDEAAWLSLVQVSRSAVRRGPQAGIPAGRTDRRAAAQDSVLDRRAARSAEARRASGPARSRADKHHRGHRNSFGRNAAPLSSGTDSRRQAARVRPALPRPGHSHRGRVHDRFPGRHRREHYRRAPLREDREPHVREL